MTPQSVKVFLPVARESELIMPLTCAFAASNVHIGRTQSVHNGQSQPYTL